MRRLFTFIILLAFCFILVVGQAFAQKGINAIPQIFVHEQALAMHTLPLNDRYPMPSVSSIFKDNILLTLNYLSGKVTFGDRVNWDEIHKPFTYEFTLKPGETFAFHDAILPQYDGKVALTTRAHYDALEGYLFDGDITGDGVCHLASLMNWTARDAGLQVVAPTNHNFADIPDVPKQYGTAIYTAPGEYEESALQNLYITNTLNKPVAFIFEYNNDVLTLKIEEK